MSARGNLVPVLVVVAAIIVLWYLGAVWLNAAWAYDQAGRAGVELGFGDLVRETWSQERPLLPAPHQVVAELWRTTVEVAPTSRRSLLRHAGITLAPRFWVSRWARRWGSRSPSGSCMTGRWTGR